MSTLSSLKLATPIQTTADDVVISGHGGLAYDVQQTLVPVGFELWVMGPPGSAISENLGRMLESGAVINKLGICMTTGATGQPIVAEDNAWIQAQPKIYAAGGMAPDYTVGPPDQGLVIQESPARIIGVVMDTRLSELWPRLQMYAVDNETIRVFWAACSSIYGTGKALAAEALVDGMT